MPKKSEKRLRLEERNKKRVASRVQKGTQRVPELLKIRKLKKSKFHIWLDVDKTLIIKEKNVQGRPHLKNFLTFCHTVGASVGLITAATEEETWAKFNEIGIRPVKPLLSRVDTWYGSIIGNDPTYYHLRGSEQVWLKYIPDFDPATTIIIDDCPNFYTNTQRPNVVSIAPYSSAIPDDEALLVVAEFMRHLTRLKNPDIAEEIIELSHRKPFSICRKEPRSFTGVETLDMYVQ